MTPWTIQSMEFSRPEYRSGLPFPSPGDLPNPGIEPSSPAMQTDSLPAESHEKPNNTGVGSLSLFQGIFPTQESNRGLLHCRQTFSQLSYHGSPGARGRVTLSSGLPRRSIWLHNNVSHGLGCFLNSQTQVTTLF